MATPYHHSLSSVKKFGGTVEDYLPLHDWFDASKAHLGDFRHRAYRHHAEGIFELERIFGVTITISTGKKVPVRLIGEQHVTEDIGYIPCLADWLRCIKPEPWMNKPTRLSKSTEIREVEAALAGGGAVFEGEPPSTTGDPVGEQGPQSSDESCRPCQPARAGRHPEEEPRAAHCGLQRGDGRLQGDGPGQDR